VQNGTAVEWGIKGCFGLNRIGLFCNIQKRLLAKAKGKAKKYII
jgi:hypothetical protein